MRVGPRRLGIGSRTPESGFRSQRVGAFPAWQDFERRLGGRRCQHAQIGLDHVEIQPRRHALGIANEGRPPSLAGLVKLLFHGGEYGQVVLNQGAKLEIWGRRPTARAEPRAARPSSYCPSLPSLQCVQVSRREPALRVTATSGSRSVPPAFRSFRFFFDFRVPLAIAVKPLRDREPLPLSVFAQHPSQVLHNRHSMHAQCTVSNNHSASICGPICRVAPISVLAESACDY